MATMYVYNIPTDETVNLRQTPGGTVLTRVPYGAAVQASSYNTTWHSVTYGDYTGYMMSEFLTPTNPNSGSGTTGWGTGQVTDGALYCRKQPQPGYAYWGRFSNGTTIPIKDYNDTWYETYWNNDPSKVGYVMSDFINRDEDLEGNTGGGDNGNSTGSSWQDVLNGSVLLKRTSTNNVNAVKQLQQYLAAIGYGYQNVGAMTIDGVFGSITENAVKYFQTECELQSDGIVGQITANKLAEVQSNPVFKNANYFPLNGGTFNYFDYPYNEESLVARIICAEHGYVNGVGHDDARAGVAKVLKNRKDMGGVSLFNSNAPRDFKNIIFGPNQYTTANGDSAAMSFRVKRGSQAFTEAVQYAQMICSGITPSAAPLVTNQLFQKGYGADRAEYQNKASYCRYPASGNYYTFFYN